MPKKCKLTAWFSPFFGLEAIGDTVIDAQLKLRELIISTWGLEGFPAEIDWQYNRIVRTDVEWLS